MVPIFTSHYSFGRSILTLKKKGESDPDGPDSIFDIADKDALPDGTLVILEDSMAGAMDAFSAADDAGVRLMFGRRFWLNDDDSDKSYCIAVFARNDDGYNKLCGVSTTYHLESHNQENIFGQIIDSMEGKKESDLVVVMPFYSSFVAENYLKGKSCVPDEMLRQINFSFLVENNGLPFDKPLATMVTRAVRQYKAGIIESKSIYYKNCEDIEAYIAYKLSCNRSASWKNVSLSNPNLEWFGSDEFCWESYLVR